MGVVDDLIATAQPRTEQVKVCARGDLVAAHAAAVEAMRQAAAADESLEGNPEVSAAAEAVVAIEAEMDAAAVVFTLRSVSRQTWADLLAAHPPSKEQRRAGIDHDPVRFPVAALAACVADPEMTVAQAEQLADVLPAGEWNRLWIAALTLNVTGTPIPKLGAATDLLRANGHSSTTRLEEGSLEAGSLDGSGEQ